MVGAIDKLSETGLLIDDALRHVREGARLDDDPVLPPLASVAPRREAIVISRDVLFEPTKPKKPEGSLGSTMPTTKLPTKRRAKRWPLVLCAFVASTFAGAAFMASPLAARPEVKHAIDA
ncbi:MAG TPA: hypothetical protein VIF62_20565, partial [Labilithrix sp.]